MVDLRAIRYRRKYIVRIKAGLNKALRPGSPLPKDFFRERIEHIRKAESELEEMEAALKAEMPKLSEEEREIVKALYLDGLDFKQVSNVWGLTERAIYYRVEKARKILNG